MKSLLDTTWREYREPQGQFVRRIELGDLPPGIYISKDKAVYWDGRDSFKEFVNFTTEDGLAHNWVNAILRNIKTAA